MDDQQLLRYSRQIMLPGIDVAGQEQLLKSRVLIVGLGGLGCPVALYLAASGVGHLVLADHDDVDLSNLQRQIAHGEADIGRKKVHSARDAIKQLNSATEVSCVSEKLLPQHLPQTLQGIDLVLDCCDNFSTRFALNEACVRHKIPLVSGAAIRNEGQLAVFDKRYSASPCYRCLYSDDVADENLSCSENGVVAPLVGVIGSMQAMAALRVIVAGDCLPSQDIPAELQSLYQHLHVFDGELMQWRRLKLNADPQCPLCAE